jgi:hypothetical protein
MQCGFDLDALHPASISSLTKLGEIGNYILFRFFEDGKLV